MSAVELLSQYRALGGVADNVQLRQGPHGWGLFVVDPGQPVRVFTPAHLLIANVLVVWAFLGSLRSALIPSLAIPVSLIGSFTVMYLCDFSLNNLSVMALIVAAGLVVDDAIVVVENIHRHLEAGETPQEGIAREVKEETGLDATQATLIGAYGFAQMNQLIH